MVRLNRLSLIPFLLLLLSGCMPERKLAVSFIENDTALAFLVIKPDFLYKTNLKEYEINGYDSLSDWQKDSLLMDKSLFLKNINDSILISGFTENFTKGLQSYGIKVYPSSLTDTFLLPGHMSYIANIAQMSLEEYVHPFTTDQVVSDEIVTIKDVDLNALNYNIWLELGKLNSDKKNIVLFASDYLLDDLNGQLRQSIFRDEITFEYTIDTITTEQIYQYGRQMGKEVSSYLFDYLLNIYINENIPPGYPYEPEYLHYDPEKRMLLPADPERRLVEMKGK